MEAPSNIKLISKCFVKPNQIIEESKKPFHLGYLELEQLSHCHLQIGLLFPKLPSKEDGGMDSFLQRLEQSLSSTLSHFYPFAGQFVTEIDEEKHESNIFIDSNKGPGAMFIHATLQDVTVGDIVTPTYVPTTIVQSFFQLGKIPTNYDAHDEPILVAQVTELKDGIFLGVSLNHSVSDGSSFWHFLSSWSEMFKSDNTKLSRPPNYERWFPQGYGPTLKIPYIHEGEFIKRYEMNNDLPISEVIFHFSTDSIEKLKAKINEEIVEETNKTSSFQAITALIWRSIVRSRNKQSEESSILLFLANARFRMNPSLSPNCVGSYNHPSINPFQGNALINNNLGWVASVLHKMVGECTHESICNRALQWIKSPFFPAPVGPSKPIIIIAGSHRENAYGIEFGLGKAVATRTGSNKYDGKVTFRPSREDKGSVTLEVCLSPDTMKSMQQDQELVSFLS